jgi:hypothetical protein
MNLKYLSIWLFLLLPLFCFPQKRIGKKSSRQPYFKFDYAFNFERLKDSNVFTLKILPARDSIRKVRGIVLGSDSQPILARVTVRDISGKERYHRMTNDIGEFIIPVEQGYFELFVTTLSHQSFTTKVELKFYEEAELEIHLAEFPVVGVYHIHSIRELTPEEISEIKNCMNDYRRREAGIDCESKGLYHISLEI